MSCNQFSRSHPARSGPTARIAGALFAIISSLSVALPSGAVMAAEPSTSAPLDAFAEFKIGGDVSNFTLDNGMEVVVIPDHRAPVATHMVWYKVGSADEAPGESGIAHFLEHLMFKGTKAHPDGEFSKIVSDIGGTENAFTSTDYTAYFQRVAKEHLPQMMELEADRMANLVLTDEVVLPERDVVLEERRMRIDNNPGAKLNETVSSMLYLNHPYAVPIIGWQDEIEQLDRELALNFYDKYYTPNNAVLIVAGDVDPEQVKAMAQSTYGKLKRRAEPGERVRAKAQTPPGVRSVTLRDPRVQQESVSLSWLVPSYNTADAQDAYALDVLAKILGDGATSRLYSGLVSGDGIAANAGGWYQSSALDDTRFTVYGTPRDGRSLDEVADSAQEIIAELIENGVSDEELSRAKRSIISSTIYAQDSQSTLARIYGSALTTGATIDEIRNWPKKLSAVTNEDIQRVAKKFLTGEPLKAYLRTQPAASTASGADKKS